MIKENEMKTQSRKHLTNLQHELLKLFSFELPDEELKEVKQMLTKYFAEKLNEETSRIWKEKGYSNELMDEWLNEERQ